MPLLHFCPRESAGERKRFDFLIPLGLGRFVLQWEPQQRAYFSEVDRKDLGLRELQGIRLAVTVISEFSELQIIQALPVSPGNLKVK